MFHVMTASVTFGNINGHTNPAPHISLHMEQGRAEPVAVVTTPTQGCRWRECGVTRRGGSFSQEGEEGEEGEREHAEATPTIPQARYARREREGESVCERVFSLLPIKL